jgi:HK97 family phage major capsid protein
MQLPGIEPAGRPDYLFRSVLASYPATGNSVFRVRETGITGAASPVAEGADKWEVTPAMTGDNIAIEVIAAYATCSRQILDDLDGFKAYLQNVLLTQLEAKVEYQLLLGSGSTPQLDSVTNNATSFDTSYLPLASSGWEFPDVLHAACTQLIVAGYRPDVIVVSPIDWSKIETLKDITGRYVIGDPKSSLSRVLWGRKVVESPALDEGVFVVLDSKRFHIRQRQDATAELSDSHNLNFTKNLVTCRLEERLCLVVAQPGAAILGSVSQSPI